MLLTILICCTIRSDRWDCGDLNELNIVTGVAVDKDENTGLYQLRILVSSNT